MPRLPSEIRITNRVRVFPHEIELSYARSGGPGGQHVNKTSSKVLLRWNLETTGALSEEQRDRVREKLASRLTSDGELLVTSERHRDQSRNVDDAVAKFTAILREALRVPTERKATKPTRGSQRRRVEGKRRRGEIKRGRRRPDADA